MLRNASCCVLVIIAWSAIGKRCTSSFCWTSTTKRRNNAPFERKHFTIVKSQQSLKKHRILPVTTTSSSSASGSCRFAIKTTTTSLDVDTIQQSLLQLPSGSDLRGQFVDLPSGITTTRDELDHGWMIQSTVEVLRERSNNKKGTSSSSLASLTPLAAYCIGYAFANYLSAFSSSPPTICIGRDPRPHGERLVEYFTKGALNFGAIVKDTGIATTPSMFEFCR
jgi:hypothetical protein